MVRIIIDQCLECINDYNMAIKIMTISNFTKYIIYLGIASGNHIQDLNRAIEYLQNLKSGLLLQEFGDLEEEAAHIVSKSKGDSADNAEQYVPRSFSRM